MMKHRNIKQLLLVFIVAVALVTACHKDPYPRGDASFITGESDKSYILNNSPTWQITGGGFSPSEGNLDIDLNNDGVNDITILYSSWHSMDAGSGREYKAQSLNPDFSIAYRPVILYNAEQFDTVFYPSKTLQSPANDTFVYVKYFISESIISKKYYNRNLGEPKAKGFRIDTVKYWSDKIDLSFLYGTHNSGPSYLRPTFGSAWTSNNDYGYNWDTIPSNYLCIKHNYKGINKYGWILLNRWNVIGAALQK